LRNRSPCINWHLRILSIHGDGGMGSVGRATGARRSGSCQAQSGYIRKRWHRSKAKPSTRCSAQRFLEGTVSSGSDWDQPWRWGRGGQAHVPADLIHRPDARDSQPNRRQAIRWRHEQDRTDAYPQRRQSLAMPSGNAGKPRGRLPLGGGWFGGVVGVFLTTRPAFLVIGAAALRRLRGFHAGLVAESNIVPSEAARFLRVSGGLDFVLASPGPAFLRCKAAAMLPALLGTLATARMVLARERLTGIPFGEGGQRQAEGGHQVRKQSHGSTQAVTHGSPNPGPLRPK